MRLSALAMGLLGKIFTWWDGATIGTSLFTSRKGTKVGEDHQGNVYYEGGTDPNGLTRRWVIYKGANDASRVPAEWHGWLHHSIDGTPESHLPPPRIWETEFTPNQTGTPQAHLPSGAIAAGGRRQMATGDYEAWTPNT
ncbi:NADH:ubiquinone oxidoreductase subunit [Sphingobium sp. B2D3A]|nr:NADH:ubiquinone oxidoreductase subunit [Sphingobium sp. B2D3A]MCW2398270.1 NADH:ubiquinone oxidoreductase subunit [Sphingobium sp. B2D3C]MCW2405728.1 NADH:ubiquinone oxidoreductase subunit [Sphingobium sp. B1D7B]